MIQILKTIYVKPKNVILAIHILSTRKQKAGESLDQFLNEFKTLAKDCDVKTVSAEQYKSEMIRDAFINGLQSNHIHQRLLENKTLDLQTAIGQARSLDVLQQGSTMFSQPRIPEVIAPIPRGAYFASISSCKLHFRVITTTLINNKYKADTLIDTGSTDRSFISEKLARLLKLKVASIPSDVGMAAASLLSQ